MTVYTNKVEFASWHPRAGMFRLWADDESELWAAALEAGCEMDQFEDTGSFPCFFVNVDQQAIAIFQGAEMSDFLGPKEYLARKRGDTATLQWIADTRAKCYRDPVMTRGPHGERVAA